MGEEEFIDTVFTLHLQNTNGRESYEEMFRLGIEAAYKERDLLNPIKTSCPICRDTGEYYTGGSFGGSVTIHKCNCKK
jgi:hypothetical protein